MPVEFALRPRIRLRESPAPARRARARLPKFALPALAYWLVIGGLVYAFVRHHDSNAPPPEAEAALAPLSAAPPPTVREWWRPLPTRATPPPSLPISEPPPSEPEALEAPLTAPAPAEPPTAEPLPKLPELPEARLSALLPKSSPKPALRPSPAPTLALAPVPVPAPTLDPLFAVAPSFAPPPTPAPAPPSTPIASVGLPSCEAALASASQEVDFSGGNRTADLPTQAIAAVLENGAWLSSCSVPEHTTLDVCVAIKGGRVVGASVSSRPADASLSACVKRSASSLQFPFSPHLDLARTRF